jgi:hypothetical protein
VALLGGRFRRRPRRIIRIASLALAPVLFAAWINAQVQAPGPSLGGAAWPWNALPASFVDDQHGWGAGYRGFDPRDEPCRSSANLATSGIAGNPGTEGEPRSPRRVVRLPLSLEGHFTDPFGGPNVFEPSGVTEGDPPPWHFVEVARDCFLTYGPAPGEG